MYGGRERRAYDRRHSHQHGFAGDQPGVPDAHHGGHTDWRSTAGRFGRRLRLSVRLTLLDRPMSRLMRSDLARRFEDAQRNIHMTRRDLESTVKGEAHES